MKKKIIAVLLSMVVCSMTVTGCGEKTTTENQEATVTEDTQSSSEAVESEITDYGPLMSEMNMSDYVTLGEYKGLTVDMEVLEPTEEEIQAQIDADLEEIAETEDITDGAVEMGDIVNIDYEGKKDGVAFQGGTAQGFDLTIGSGQFIEGFEDGLIGATVGQTLDLDLTFPEQYHAEELAGAAVVFTVKVNSIQRKNVPELTDEIVPVLDNSCTTIDELKVAVRDYLYNVNKDNASLDVKSKLVDMAAAASEVKEIPEGLLKERIDYMLSSTNSYASAYGMTYEQFITGYMNMTIEEFEERCKSEAPNDVKKDMVAYAIAQQEGLEVTDEEAKAELEQYIQYFNLSSYEELMKTPEGRGMLEGMQLTKVVEFLYENANVNEVTKTQE